MLILSDFLAYCLTTSNVAVIRPTEADADNVSQIMHRTHSRLQSTASVVDPASIPAMPNFKKLTAQTTSEVVPPMENTDKSGPQPS